MSVAQIADKKVAPSPLSELRAGLDKMAPQFQMALPRHLTPDRFVRVVMTAVQNNPDLIACDRRSLFNASMRAAQDGLLPDGREGAIVAFNDSKSGKKVAQWLPMVFGLIKKIRQSGELSTISSNVVYENDEFSYVLGDDERIEHRPCLTADRGKAILAYAVAKLKDGGIQREVMTIADIEKARNVSRAKNSLMWTTFWSEGARKTVLRRLCKFLPLSADDRRTIERDDEDTDFGRQKAAARDALLSKASEQIGAPAPAITHQPSVAPPVTEGETIDEETGEIVDETVHDGEIVQAEEADADAITGTTDRMIEGLADCNTDAEISEYEALILSDLNALPLEERRRYAAVKLARQKVIKGRK